MYAFGSEGPLLGPSVCLPGLRVFRSYAAIFLKQLALYILYESLFFRGGDFLDFYSALYFLRTTRRHGQGSDCQIGSSPTARLARRRLQLEATVKCRSLRKIGSCGLRSERETARHCLLTADLRRK